VILPAPALIAVGLVIALLVLLPARRLQHAGFGSRSIGSYALCLWGLAFLLAIRPGATRFLIPILLIAYLAPFVVAPERLGRIVRRGGQGGRGDGDDPPKPPMKNVTPPDGPIEPG
jgi:hypothetical protein